MITFADFGVSKAVVGTLERRDITTPTEIQEMVLVDALEGKDVLAKSKTGSGKTLAFAIPIVERLDPEMKRPAAVVLVPTRELAVQVTDEMHDIAGAKNLRVAPVYGGVGLEKQAQRAAKAHVIVATPGRLMDLMNRRLISLERIRILVLDEADRMLDMGFQPQVDRILESVPDIRQTMFFSATLDGTVGFLARSYTKDAQEHEVVDLRPVIEEADHRFIQVSEHGKLDRLIEVLREDRGLALIFVRTKRGADRLRSRLRMKKLDALAMHGDLTQAARQRALERFTSGKVDVMIATDVAARGLDVDGITHVINYDPPGGHKDYVHRVGRTARAGRSGTGITFVSPSQQAEVSAIARQLKLKEEFQEAGMAVAAPTVVFSSHGKRSSLRPRRKRRV